MPNRFDMNPDSSDHQQENRHEALARAVCVARVVRSRFGVCAGSRAWQPDHAALLASSDPKLAANKRLVYDFWREVFEAGHVELAPKYMTETYIQHNPLVASGREPFIGFLTKFVQPKPIEPKVKAPLVAILAEGDLVVFVFARELEDPKDKTQK